MAVIAIARELASLGEEVAQELAQITGYRHIDREHLEKRLGDFGIGPEKRQKYDEKKPGLWASLSQARDDYLHYLKTAVFEEAAAGNCVIVGRGSTAILRGLPNLVSVRLVSSIATRIERIKTFYSCDEKRALQIIEQSDHDRAGFNKYFFSLDWRDPREYGIVLNTSESTPEALAQTVNQYRMLCVNEDRESAGGIRIAELLLGQNVVTEILYEKRVPVHFLEADARGGRITLHGVSNTQAAIDAAVAAARGVKGVSEVESAIQVVQEFAVMP